MGGNTGKRRPERDNTDESLRVERKGSDVRTKEAVDLLLERPRDAITAERAVEALQREDTNRNMLIERARSDEALEHRDDFLGVVSHDLRNLLNGIVLHARLVAKTVVDTDEGRRIIAAMTRIHCCATRMDRLIGDLVDMMSLDAGRLAVQPTRCDVAALLTEAVDEFLSAAAEQGLTLECATVEHPLVASFDHARMHQVLANLIANALKFTPRGGKIVVRGERSGGETHLSVGDSGIGIPIHMLELVFERFCRLEKNNPKGLGLGLYISRCIVEAHGGKIWAESTPGEGSVFHLTIPDAVPPEARMGDLNQECVGA